METGSEREGYRKEKKLTRASWLGIGLDWMGWDGGGIDKDVWTVTMGGMSGCEDETCSPFASFYIVLNRSDFS